MIEVIDLKYPNKKIIIKEYYNFIPKQDVINYTFTEKSQLLLTLLEELYVEFDICLNNRFLLSTAAIAFKIFKTKFKDQHKKILRLNSFLDIYIRKSFYGGRNEIYTHINNYDNYYYDINSLYPFIMKHNVFPIDKPIYLEEGYFCTKDFDLANFYGFFDILISVDKSITTLPVLPYKFTEINTKKPGLGNIYPKGVFRNIFYSEELKYALTKGYKIIKIYSGVKYETVSYIFDGFVDLFYNKRLNSKNKVYNNFYKTCLNSLYGRFALIAEETRKNTLEDFFIPPETKDFIFFSYKTRFNNIGIASAISAYSRMYIHDIMEKNKLTFLYLDTDGIFVKEPLPSHLVTTKKQLGKFRLISKNKEAYFIAGKFYLYKRDKDPDFTYVLRGVPTNNIIYDRKELLTSFQNILLNILPLQTCFNLTVCFMDEQQNLIEITFNFKLKRKIIVKNNSIHTEPWIICVKE